MFLTDEQYDETQTSIRDKYNVNPARHLTNLKISTLVTDIAYEVFLTIPIEFEKTRSHIFQIINMKLFRKTTLIQKL